MEERLSQAEKMESVGRLAGGVAHDFNNMLGVIAGNAELALEIAGPEDPLHEELQAILDAADRSADLTRQLLAFARKQEVMPRVLDLNATVSGMLRMLSRLIGEDIDLVWEPGADLWPVLVDPSQIDQVLVNLCVNARDAITDGGRIVIETRNTTSAENGAQVVRPGDYVQVTVTDDGQGMDESTLEKVYEPFFTTKEVGRGTGLGLTTVYGILQQNGGTIDLASSPGAGTAVNLYFPRSDSPLPHGDLSATAVDHRPPGGDEVILVVEDQQGVLNLATRVLRGLGYTVWPAASPEEAIRLAEDGNLGIAMLLTDVVMPGMNGWDLCNTLKEGNPALKCAFMSGYTANTLSRRGVLDVGLNFVQKPFRISELAAVVRRALDE